MYVCLFVCSLKPYNIKGKTVTTNVVDSAAAYYQLTVISGLQL